MTTQVILNVENPSILPSLKRVLSAIDGVSIIKPKAKPRLSAYETSMKEIEEGKVEEITDLDAYFAKFGVTI